MHIICMIDPFRSSLRGKGQLVVAVGFVCVTVTTGFSGGVPPIWYVESLKEN